MACEHNAGREEYNGVNSEWSELMYFIEEMESLRLLNSLDNTLDLFLIFWEEMKVVA